MRISPNGTVVAFTHGYGGGPLSVEVVDLATGGTLASLPAGHDPRWLGDRSLLARSPDGQANMAEGGGFSIGFVGANLGDLDARNARAVFCADRSAGVDAYVDGALVRNYPATFEPGLSAGGTIALRDLVSGMGRLERLDGCGDAAAHDPNLGAITRPRWSSQSIVWDGVPFGRIFGRSSPDQPTVELSVPARSTSFPVVFWSGVALFVAFVMDDGELAVAEWGSLCARESKGWRVGQSGGSAFDWDLAAVPGNPSVLRVTFLTPAGELDAKTIDTRDAPVSLAPTTPPDPPDPPDPEPLPPDPETPDMNPTVDMIPRDQTVRAGDSIDQYLRANPRLGLPAGLWPEPWESADSAARLDVVSAYLIGEWCPEVCRLGPFPGDAAGWDTRRDLGLQHTFNVIESERGEKPPAPEPGEVQGPIGVDGRHFTVPG